MFYGLHASLEAQGVEVKAVRGLWAPGSEDESLNYHRYRQAIAAGDSPRVAASKTWTAQRAREFGFPVVASVLESDSGTVTARFIRLPEYWTRGGGELPPVVMRGGQAHINGGEGVPVNYTEAMRWFQLAADRGYLEAWYDLGVMCERGQGIKADDDLALAMYRKAAESKDADLRRKAQKAVNRLLGFDDDEDDGRIG